MDNTLLANETKISDDVSIVAKLDPEKGGLKMVTKIFGKEIQLKKKEKVNKEEKVVEKKKKYNPVDYVVVFGTLGLLNTTDFIVDDVICGGLSKKVKEKKASAENKCFFNAVKENAAKIFKKENKKEVKTTAEEETYGQELPAVIEEVEEEPKATFTVVPDVEHVNTLSNADLNNLIKKYNYTSKLLSSALLWLCGKIDEHQVGAVLVAIDANEEYRTDNINFINSVTKFFADKVFATNPIFTDKEFNVNPTDLRLVVADLSHLDCLNGNEMLSVIIDKTRKYVEEKTGEYVVIFDNAKLDLFKSDAPKAIISKVETYFGDYINGLKHVVMKLDTGMVKLQIVYDPARAPREFVIDPAIAFGTDYKVAGLDEAGNTVFVSPTVNPQIVAGIFADPDYRISLEDAFKCIDSQGNLRQYDLYVNYDFTNCHGKIAELSFEDKERFQDKLLLIRKMIESEFNCSPRMRIKNFKDADAFIIVSDNKCKCQHEEFAAVTLDGLRVKVLESKYIVELVDETGNIISTKEHQFVEGSEKMMRNPFADYSIYNQANRLFNVNKAPEEPTVKVDFTQK